jgi:hypothetical protein
MNDQFVSPVAGGRELRECLFDVQSYAQAGVMPPIITFFGHTQDVSGPQVTNMTKANELPAGERMQVYSLKIALLNAAAADLAKVRKLYRVRVFVAEKPVLTGPTMKFPYGGNAISEGTEVSAIPFFINDDTLVIDIPEGVRFRVELQSSTGYTLADGTKGMDILVELDGIHTVPIN